MARLIALTVLAAVLGGCSDDDNKPADGGADLPPSSDLSGFPDATADLTAADQLAADQLAADQLAADQATADGSPSDPCQATTSDGIKLNPGCDPDFQANGPSALGQFIDSGGNPAWVFLAGTKYWLFNPTALSGKGAFTAGGKDIATMVKTMAPTDCTSLAPSGMPLNPGCDTDFSSTGPTVIGTTRAGTGSDAWLFTSGKKFWLYDPVGSSFIAAGPAVSAATLLLQPTSCSATGNDGTPLNPGCNQTFVNSGPTAGGEFSVTSGATVWLFTAGTTYWLFDPNAGAGGAFTAAGADLSTVLASLQPGCSTTAADGTPLNPACDSDFKANGPTALGQFLQPSSGANSWMVTSGKKFWMLDSATLTFVSAGADLAVELRKHATL